MSFNEGDEDSISIQPSHEEEDEEQDQGELATGATVTVVNRCRKNDDDKQMHLSFSSSIGYIKDLVGIKPETSMYLTTTCNGREVIIESDEALQSYLMIVRFAGPMGLDQDVSTTLEVKYRKLPKKKTIEQGRVICSSSTLSP